MIRAFVHDPPYIGKHRTGRIDLWGIGFLALGFGLLQVVLDTGQRKDWFGSMQIRIFSALCIFGLVAMVVRELRTKHPIVDLRVLKDRTFAAGVSLMTMLGFVLYGSLMLLPIFLQTLHGYPALQSGLALSPRGIGSLLMMPVAGELTNRFDPRKLIGVGLVVGAWTMFSLSHLKPRPGSPEPADLARHALRLRRAQHDLAHARLVHAAGLPLGRSHEEVDGRDVRHDSAAGRTALVRRSLLDHGRDLLVHVTSALLLA
jgi:hypothetical protein